LLLPYWVDCLIFRLQKFLLLCTPKHDRQAALNQSHKITFQVIKSTCCLCLLTWNSRQQFHLKCWYQSTKLHSTTHQNIVNLIFTSMISVKLSSRTKRIQCTMKLPTYLWNYKRSDCNESSGENLDSCVPPYQSLWYIYIINICEMYTLALDGSEWSALHSSQLYSEERYRSIHVRGPERASDLIWT
jgi:hypothetical protein